MNSLGMRFFFIFPLSSDWFNAIQTGNDEKGSYLWKPIDIYVCCQFKCSPVAYLYIFVLILCFGTFAIILDIQVDRISLN